MKSMASALTIAAALVISAPALAEDAAPSLLSSDKISRIAGSMFQSYQAGRVNQMLADENDCWEDAARGNTINRKIVAACAVAATAGAFIEATYARSQRRGANPQYTGEAIRARILKKSRLSEDEIDGILASTIQPNIGAIMVGLNGAGMR